jgi:hypothetical protein
MARAMAAEMTGREHEGDAEMEAHEAHQRAHADGGDDHDAQLELDRREAVERSHSSAAA